MLVHELEKLLEEYNLKKKGLFRSVGFTSPAIKSLEMLLAGKQPTEEVSSDNLARWIWAYWEHCRWDLPERRENTYEVIAVGIMRSLGFNALFKKPIGGREYSVFLPFALGFSYKNFGEGLLADPANSIRDTNDLFGFLRVASAIETNPKSVFHGRTCPIERLLFGQPSRQEAHKLATGGSIETRRLLETIENLKKEAARRRRLISTPEELEKVIEFFPSLAGELSHSLSAILWFPHLADQLLFNPNDREGAARLRGLITTAQSLKNVIDCRPDLADQLLFNPDDPEDAARLRGLITSWNRWYGGGLDSIIRCCPSLADQLLFNPDDPEDAARLRGLIATGGALVEVIELRPSLADQLLFNPNDREGAARLRGLITTAQSLKNVIDLRPDLADQLLFNPDDPEGAARLRGLITTAQSLKNVIDLRPDLADKLLFNLDDPEGAARLRELITTGGLWKVVVMVSLEAALADWNFKFSKEFFNFLSKKPISEESGEAAASSVPSTVNCSGEFIRLLDELISLSESRKEKLEKEIGTDCLLALPKPSENPFSILAYAIALSEFNAVPESEMEHVQNAESALNKLETKEAEALAENLGAQVKAENLLEAARYLLSIPGVNVNPITAVSDVSVDANPTTAASAAAQKDLRNAVVLSRVFLLHIQSGLIGLNAEENPALEAYREAIRNTVGAIEKILPDLRAKGFKSTTTTLTQTAETTFFASTQKTTPEANGPTLGAT